MTNAIRSDISLRVNSTTHRLTVDHHRTLLDAVREDLHQNGPKKGCGGHRVLLLEAGQRDSGMNLHIPARVLQALPYVGRLELHHGAATGTEQPDDLLAERQGAGPICVPPRRSASRPSSRMGRATTVRARPWSPSEGARGSARWTAISRRRDVARTLSSAWERTPPASSSTALAPSASSTFVRSPCSPRKDRRSSPSTRQGSRPHPVRRKKCGSLQRSPPEHLRPAVRSPVPSLMTCAVARQRNVTTK